MFRKWGAALFIGIRTNFYDISCLTIKLVKDELHPTYIIMLSKH